MKKILAGLSVLAALAGVEFSLRGILHFAFMNNNEITEYDFLRLIHIIVLMAVSILSGLFAVSFFTDEKAK